MTRTYIKGYPTTPPKNLVHITGGDVEIRDLVLDFNRLGEKRKFYRDADRGEHDPRHYQWLTQVKAAETWKKLPANRGKSLPPELVPPPQPSFPEVERRNALLGKPLAWFPQWRWGWFRQVSLPSFRRVRATIREPHCRPPLDPR